MTQADWNRWHDAYDDPGSWQSRRLVTVRERIRAALDGASPGPLEGFEKVFQTGPEVLHAVHEHRSLRDPVPLEAGTKLFTFVGIRALRPWAYPKA